nr:MAG: hypothetical protein [Bacteriophage sp.]
MPKFSARSFILSDLATVNTRDANCASSKASSLVKPSGRFSVGPSARLAHALTTSDSTPLNLPLA